MSDGPRPTAEYIEVLGGQALERFISATKHQGSIFDHERFKGVVRDTLMEFYEMKFSGCPACADEGYHLARASMLSEVTASIEADAASLWVKRQDKEAHYLRDVVAAPFRSKRAEELAHAEKFGAGFHSCTLTGLHP